MAERVLNAGVVGLGVGAVGILRQLEMSSTFRLCAGADTDTEVRAGFQRVFPDVA